MSRVRFSIAKYVPDLRRMEPRNIGVVVWSETGVAARFAGEFASRPGEVDGRSIPKFVNSASAYRQWIRHWRKVLDKPSVRSSSGELTSRSSPAFLKALAGDERGNYYLVESGELLDPPEPEGIEVFTAWLYEQLVAETLASDEPRDPKLDELCQKAIDETGLGYSRYLRRNYSVEIPLPANSAGSVSERFEFSYAFGNGHP
ncbi:MAG TPA: hypothetical protein VGE52_21460, partial [Pirellulales bacterium]